MKKTCLAMSTFVIGVALMGCATSGDLAKVQTEERLIGEKADRAYQEAQAAKAAADAANAKAEAAAARAETAAKAAEEKEKLADERAARAEAAFQRSMKK